MARVLILGDERKGASRDVLEEMTRWLRGEGHDVQASGDRASSLEDADADLVCVFGGDGTILGAARRMGTNQMPTLGINFGRLGFLTVCGPEQAKAAVSRALAGELREEPRSMMECNVQRQDGRSEDPVLALNDAVVNRVPTSGMIALRAFRGNQELAAYAGDGLIVSTPTGSTAYSLSAGGPVLSPDIEALLLTPLASHSLALRPLVMPFREGLDVVVRESGGDQGATLVLDGQVASPLGIGDRLQLRPAAHKFRHLVWNEDSFFRVFRRKLGWSDVPRERQSPREGGLESFG